MTLRKDVEEPRSWFTAKAPATGETVAEIAIYDEIGYFGVSAQAFRDALGTLGEVSQINLRINSPGGEVFDGIAVYNMLKRHTAKVNVTVDGIAASMASVVAMAGDSIVMPENAMMMIHNPSGFVVGTSDDMREIADALDKMKQGLVSAYVSKTGMTKAKVEKLMSDTTWMTAKEAVEMGFADKVDKPVKAKNTFDLSRYKNAPAPVGDEASRQQEVSMTAQNDPAGKAAEKALADKKALDDAAAAATAAAATAAAASATAKTPEQITADAVNASIKQSADIIAACELAGFVGKATEFITAKKSLPEVIAELKTLRAAKPASGKGKEGEDDLVTSRSNPDGRVTASWDKHVGKVNARVNQQQRKAG